MPGKPPTTLTKKKSIILGFLLVVLVVFFFGIQWITYERAPLPEALEALKSDQLVSVTEDPWMTFSPTQTEPNTGLIFYPGGRINPQGYAPLMRAIASEGYLVVVPEMPFNIAAFQPDIAEEVINHHPDIEQWVMGGHSVGGTMAAQYTNTHRESIDGLVIWASYTANNADLSSFDQSVSLIYGSLDPGVNDSHIIERQNLLPEDTDYVRINGGDHHQFGSYEVNPKDQHATISREAQQVQIIHSTLAILKSITKTK